MTPTKHGNPKNHRPPMRRSALATVLILLASGATMAGDNEADRLPGYVDPAPFLALADEDGELVEISIPGKLLKAFAGPFAKEEPEVASLVGGLEWIGAVIVGTEDPARIRKAKELFDQTEARLIRKGWERLARIRQEGSTVKVLILNTETTIGGLVVMVREDDQIIFTNIAGVIDLEKLGELGKEMEIPGLEEIAGD